jgi:DsbC/DsbD-like thiol-disulfide interchange protein
MDIRSGWHTYWKNPGDSGLPLRIRWNLPAGFSAGEIQWPAPERFEEHGLVTYGYHGDVLLPVEIAPPADLNADSVTIGGAFVWLECAEICLPDSARLSLTLPVGRAPPTPGPSAPAFTAALSQIPAKAPGWTFSAEAGPRAILLAFRAPLDVSPKTAYLFVDQPLLVDYAAPQGFERTGNGYRLTMTPNANAPKPPERLTGVLAVTGASGAGRVAVQVDVPVVAGDPAPAPIASEGPLRNAAPYAAVAGVAVIGLAALWLRSRAGRKKFTPGQNPTARSGFIG